MRTAGGNNGSSECGFKFLITLQPSSSLPLQIVYRPSAPQSQRFALPLSLQHSYSAAANEGGASVSGAGSATQPAVSAAAQRRVTSDRRASVSNAAAGHHPKPGSAAGSSKAAAAAAVPDAPPKLGVPVEAEGVVPKIILSKTALDFGSRVARGALQGGKSPHLFHVTLRNNTDSTLQVAVGAPAAASLLQKPSSSQASIRPDAPKKHEAGTAEHTSSSSAYCVEGWDTRPSAGFVSLGPDEALGFTVRFSPTEAKLYEACVPIHLDGCRTAAYMQLRLTGSGTLPRLTFDVAECVLPMVSVCWEYCFLAYHLFNRMPTYRMRNAT